MIGERTLECSNFDKDVFSLVGDNTLQSNYLTNITSDKLLKKAPVGFFDPLKLSADGDVATFKRRRAAELKHGRVCMLATLGYIVPEYPRRI